MDTRWEALERILHDYNIAAAEAVRDAENERFLNIYQYWRGRLEQALIDAHGEEL